MARCRLSPRLVALLVYALAVNAILWAQTAIAAVDARHVTCGPATLASALATKQTDGIGAHACCDLACAVQGTLAPPSADPALSVRFTANQIAIESAQTTIAAWDIQPNARGPPIPL